MVPVLLLLICASLAQQEITDNASCVECLDGRGVVCNDLSRDFVTGHIVPSEFGQCFTFASDDLGATPGNRTCSTWGTVFSDDATPALLQFSLCPQSEKCSSRQVHIPLDGNWAELEGQQLLTAESCSFFVHTLGENEL